MIFRWLFRVFLAIWVAQSGLAHSAQVSPLHIAGRVDEQMYDSIRTFEGRSIVINSPGGDVLWGMRIAEIIVDRDFEVTIDGVCISACFSYVFLPAARRVLRPRAELGLHIGPIMLLQAARSQGLALPEWDKRLAGRMQAILLRRGLTEDLFQDAARRFNVRLLGRTILCPTDGDPPSEPRFLPCQTYEADVRTWYLSTSQLRHYGISFEGAEIQYKWIGDVPFEILFYHNNKPQYFGDCLLDANRSPAWDCKSERESIEEK